jgi:hypothetical protein
MNMETLVLMFIRMTLVLLAESCHGDWTQWQQSVLKIAKSTVKVHLAWHDIYIATETGRLLCVTPCACTRATVKERGTYTMMHKYYHKNCSMNKQNCDVQTCEWRGSAVYEICTLRISSLKWITSIFVFTIITHNPEM